MELLAPAGDADIGVAAVEHGADAVYIGAPKFSARAGAGVALGDLERLVRRAHLFYAKVYVALNTILTDGEVAEARGIVRSVYDLGADGLIIQDRGLLELDLPPIPLIASTQAHNDTPEKVRFLEAVGVRRAILARELSLAEIAAIRRAAPKIELEVFVHGALCVSYSGQCYMSQVVAGRSGNRGVCAQPCRSRYTLTDGVGRRVEQDKFLLSLKDLDLMGDLGALVEAGVTSFKIEGRYKDARYVKNVTAAWRQALDAFIAARPGYRRASSGRSEFSFTPDPARSFNRGFTRYFISGARDKAGSIDTQKSVGKPVGTVARVGRGFFQLDGERLHNGDGLCFFTGGGGLSGFRVERVDPDGKAFPNSMRGLAQGVPLHRNHDAAFDRLLQGDSARRRVDAAMAFAHEGDVARLTATDEDGNRAELSFDAPYVAPRDPGRALAQVERRLAAAGGTAFRIGRTEVSGRVGFLPVGFLNRMRRDSLAELAKVREANRPRPTAPVVPNDVPYPEKQVDFRANVLNRLARAFYERHGAQVVEPALESFPAEAAAGVARGREVMRTKYCLRHQLDACLREGGEGGGGARRIPAPLRLRDNLHVYRLEFDCERCRMSVVLEK
ncbi:MAG: U32 family peptidase [Acidobacteriota bacterium]|nr:U32 family peptidase [Acidobacteriota bacterium]